MGCLPSARAFAVACCVLGMTTAGAGCADECLDDGFGQKACPVADGTDEGESSADTTVTTTVSTSATTTADDSESGDETTTTGSESSSSEATTTEGDATSTDDDTGGQLWCVDADGDGFGDPDRCVNADDPPPGSVDNGDDCDDADPDTFPGAAENEPAVGDTCMHDGDGDGWGDADPERGVMAGADCHDANAALSPDTLGLAAMLRTPQLGAIVAEVSEVDGTLSSVMPIAPGTTQWNPVSATIDGSGTLVVNNFDDATLWSVDWVGYCTGATDEAVAVPLATHGIDVFCGIAFGRNGALFGVETAGDTLTEFDYVTGEPIDSIPILLDGMPFDVVSCGLTFDCHEQRLLMASGSDGNLYALDVDTGALELLVDLVDTWTPTGLGYDPIDRLVHIAADDELYRVALDGSDTVDTLGSLSFGMGPNVSVSNLDELPLCVP